MDLLSFIIPVVASIFIGIVALLLAREVFILSFKCSYYEQKLKDRGVDISSVDRIGVFAILKS